MAVVDYFLKIDGIPGESTDKFHKGEIQVESFSFGEAQAGTSAHGSGGGAGKVHMQDFHFVTQFSKASPSLFLACATGQHIKSAYLFCRKAGGKQEEFLKISLSDLIVSSYQTGGSGGSDIIPMDQVSFNFSKIEMEYKEQTKDGAVSGPVKAGYDLKANIKV
ncbi:MAG TPA: type VI secretion system tube protein Hcp [Gemmatimonadaceae bacterium]|jgi:type VI secretion system secreted protein Hcp